VDRFIQVGNRESGVFSVFEQFYDQPLIASYRWESALAMPKASNRPNYHCLLVEQQCGFKVVEAPLGAGMM